MPGKVGLYLNLEYQLPALASPSLSPLLAVFSELLGRILDLDVQEYGPDEAKMVITVFQYASYLLAQGR